MSDKRHVCAVLEKLELRKKMLVFTNILNHPLTSRANYLVRFLLERQIDVKVFDLSFYSQNRSALACLKDILSFPSKTLHSTSSYIRLPSLPFSDYAQNNLGSMIHFLHSILAFLLSKFITRYLDYDVVVSTDPIGALVAISARKTNALFVYEDIDCFEDLQTGRIQRTFVSFSERLCLKLADLVVCVSTPLLTRARLLNSQCILVPNGANLSCFSGSKEMKREPIIAYVGSIDEWAGLRLVIEAFPLLRKRVPRITMKIAGDGKDRQLLEEIVGNLSLQDSVFFVGKLTYDEMARLLSGCRLGVAMFKPGKAAIFASPLKLFDYMAAGVPIVATDLGDIRRIIKESESGIVVNWNIEEFVEAAEQLLTSTKLWSTCHENGLRYVQKYDWENLLSNWLREIQSRVRGNNSFVS